MRSVFSAVMMAVMVGTSAGFAPSDRGSTTSVQETDFLKIGERFTYSLRIDGFENAGIVDLHVASEGKFRGTEVFEVNLKIKTFEIVNAAFFALNETRTSYISKSSGLPLAVRRVVDAEGFPSRSGSDYFDRAPAGLDLVSAIYKLRMANGQGQFRLTEGGRNYWLDAELGEKRRIRTEAGEFDTVESRVRSEYFTEIGLKDVRVFLSSDAARIPVLFEFTTKLGPASARLSGASHGAASESAVVEERPSPTPAAGAGKPAVKPTPLPYVDNKPLGEDVPFGLGESLTYRVRNGTTVIGSVRLEVKERKLSDGKDSVLFLGTVTEASPSAEVFSKDDRLKVWADPGSFLPRSADITFNGALSVLNHSSKFDQASGTAVPGGGAPMTVPVGTHSLLSLIYAIRTFNLKQSSSAGNPVNDTRVSVFWSKSPLVFTIRPAGVQAVSVNGVSLRARLVDVITGDAQLDALKLRLWLSDDAARTPLKISVGTYSAELIPPSATPSR